MSAKPLSLYVHLPFCAAKCAYCDFASYPDREDVWSFYVDTVLDEFANWSGLLKAREVQTIFLGGGTPSLLPDALLEKLLNGIANHARVASNVECTMETNPGTLTLEKLRMCRGAGVNRLSIGAQSMNDALLRALGRIHCADDVREAVRMARRAGFENVSLDLMYALPGQTMDDWMRTIEEATALEPEHLSAYSLILEEGTPLATRAAQGQVEVPDDDACVEMQRAAVERLAAGGWRRYEISNFARAGYECRHNLVYWLRGEYLGVGCAAHSLVEGERFENPRSMEAYLSGQRRQNAVFLSREDAMEETLMLSTRTTRGLELAQWRAAFGEDFEQKRVRALDRLEKWGMTERRDGFVRLTQKGMELQNAVVLELLEDE